MKIEETFLELRFIQGLTDKNVYSYYYEIKKEMCIICFQKVSNKAFKLKLPCGCILCCKKCIIKHLICILEPYFRKEKEGK